jgi:hypothetical protein
LVIELNDTKRFSEFSFKPNQTFDLNNILDLESKENVTVYIVLNSEERKYFSIEIPKWKVLKTDKRVLIKDLLNCKFQYTDSDVSTIQSKLYIYSGDELVFESNISLEEKNLGFQNSYIGWVSSIDDNNLLKIIKQFDRYNLPFLIID